jgi:uncharacterized protein (TIGR02246 family)
MKAFFCSLILVLSLSFTLNAQTAADEKAVGDLFTQLLDLSMKGDVDALAPYLAEKATAIFFTGLVVEGKQAIHETMKAFTASNSPDDTMELDGSTVRFIDADHALVGYQMHGTGMMEGQKMDWKAVGTILFARNGKSWLIELMQDTPVMPMPGQ